ncbi:MAG: DUF72 domain-containing protein [Chitinophagaceae bacterium]|nr:DUF72 domain-containing protein [Oligoflexus sp.]
MTPPNFRFAVKLSRVFTHYERLVVDPEILKVNLAGIMRLGEKLGVLLIQLPPKLAFNLFQAYTFFTQLCAIYEGPIVVEPRHLSWVNPEALALFRAFKLGKVIADPEPCPSGQEFQGSPASVCYFRWHGSPVIYESRYEQAEMHALRRRAEEAAHFHDAVWIIFDNTTFGWATVNALEMKSLLISQAPKVVLDRSAPRF